MATTADKNKSLENKSLNGVSRRDLVEFLQGEKITALLDEAYDMAMTADDERVKASMITDFFDRYFGRAPQSIDVKSDGEKLGNGFDFSKLDSDGLKQLATILAGVNA